MIVFTKSSMFIIKYLADLLGIIMNGVYNLIEKIGIPNVGLAIIIFTIIIYAVMTPLQVKQQKFSKLNALMQPEIKKIQVKYKGKRDQLSMQKQNEEIQGVYAKYGVSATGSCVQIAIQLVVLFALYQVIYHIPGYISSIGDKLRAVAETSGFAEFFTAFVAQADQRNLNRLIGDGTTENIIDTLYNLGTDNWNALLTSPGVEKFADVLNSAHEYIHKVTYFLGLNISDTPMQIISSAWRDKSFILIIAAILIPVLAYITQVINYKLMPQAAPASNGEMDSAAATMKSMNTVMPVVSAVICFTLPVGIGIYWIAGAVIRGIQQFSINKYFDKVGLEKVIEKGRQKAEEKAKRQNKKGTRNITQTARTSTKRLETEKPVENTRNTRNTRNVKNIKASENTSSNTNRKYREGSLASKANMVQKLDQGKNKKR